MAWAKRTKPTIGAIGTTYAWGTQTWGTSPYGGNDGSGSGSWTKRTKPTSSWTKRTKAS